MTLPRNVAPALVGAAAIAFGVFAEDQRRQLGRPLDLAALDLLAGVVFVAAGVAVYLRRPANRSWWLLMAAGASWFLSTLAGSPNEDLVLLGFSTGAWHYLFLAWLLLSFPTGQVRGSRGRYLLAAMIVLLMVRTIARLYLYVPPDGTGCRCVSNKFTHVSDPRWFDATERAFPWLVTLVFVLVVVETTTRWRGSSGPGRRILTPVLAMGVAVAVQIAYAQVLRQELSWAVVRADDLFVVVVLTRAVAAASFAAGIVRTRSTRSAVVGVMGGLDSAAAPERLAMALRSALEDPSLVLLPWSAGNGAYVDTSGRTFQLPPGPGRAVTMIDGEIGPLAALVHDEALLEDPGLVSAVAATVRLTIDNERLRGELQARLDDLAASRSRIIAAGDAERRRIERDLHDGIQQRLVTTALRLRLANAKLPDGDSDVARDALTTAVEDLSATAEEVRQLARGIHPALLEESGLQGALESLLDRSPLAVRADFALQDEPSPAAAAAAYFTVAEALTNTLKHAGECDVDLKASTIGGRLRVEVTDHGVGGARNGGGSGLTGLEDRVRAAGGTLQLVSPPGAGTRIEVDLPCG
jgi:signal transduction histidine kinase